MPESTPRTTLVTTKSALREHRVAMDGTVAAVLTMEKRIQTGRWDALAEPHRMQALADSLGLDSAAFVRFRVPEFLGDRPTPPRFS